MFRKPVGRSRGGVAGRPGVGEEIGGVGGRSGGQSGEEIGEVGPRVESVSPRGAADAQEHGGGFQPAVAADMQPILAVMRSSA